MHTAWETGDSPVAQAASRPQEETSKGVGVEAHEAFLVQKVQPQNVDRSHDNFGSDAKVRVPPRTERVSHSSWEPCFGTLILSTQAKNLGFNFTEMKLGELGLGVPPETTADDKLVVPRRLLLVKP